MSPSDTRYTYNIYFIISVKIFTIYHYIMSWIIRCKTFFVIPFFNVLMHMRVSSIRVKKTLLAEFTTKEWIRNLLSKTTLYTRCSVDVFVVSRPQSALDCCLFKVLLFVESFCSVYFKRKIPSYYPTKWG